MSEPATLLEKLKFPWNAERRQQRRYTESYASRIITQLLHDYDLLSLNAANMSNQGITNIVASVKAKHKIFTATNDDAYQLQ